MHTDTRTSPRQRLALAVSLLVIALVVIAVVRIHRADLAKQTYISNFSTRARVGVGADVMVSGLVVRDQTQTVLVRVQGPSLQRWGISDALKDPVVQVLHQGSGRQIGRNDNWMEPRHARMDGDLKEFRPGNPSECILIVKLEPGSYSVVVEGRDRGQGVALLEIYRVKD